MTDAVFQRARRGTVLGLDLGVTMLGDPRHRHLEHLHRVKSPYTVRSVGAAFNAVHSFDTGMLCERWTFGDYPLHIPNNSGYIVTPQNGEMQPARGCTPIPGSDPLISAYRRVAG